MYKRQELAVVDPQVVVKIPVTPDGLAAVKQLGQEGIRTNVTLVFSTAQAILAAAAGADFVSPFVGRLDDRGEDGLGLVGEIMTVFNTCLLYTSSYAGVVAVIAKPFDVHRLRELVTHHLFGGHGTIAGPD